MSFKAVLFDAYGTLILNQGITAVGQCIVDDHRLSATADDVCRIWSDFYFEATQVTPFRTLREIHCEILPRVLRTFEVIGGAEPYVDRFFQATTQIQLYPETLSVLQALQHVRCAILSNADEEHLAAWPAELPVEFVLISEAVGAYKPDRRMFERAVARLGVDPADVLHVGDSDVDDVQGAKSAGLRVAWVNRDGRARRAGVPAPDYEIPDLTSLPALVLGRRGVRDAPP